jgi:xanthine dehydrogenase accessory factor
MNELDETIARWRREGVQLALATVINVEGSAPRGEGAKMVITADGKIAGSVSGGCVESAVAHEAAEVLASGSPRIARFGIDKEMSWDVGLSCGGAIDVFIQPLVSMPLSVDARRASAVCTIVRGPAEVGTKLVVDEAGAVSGELGDHLLRENLRQAAQRQMPTGRSTTLKLGDYDVFIDVNIPPPRALLVGAVHIAVALCAFASRAGFAVTMIDPRPSLNNRERFPDAHELRVEWPDEALASLRIDDATYVAVLAHDEKFDDPTLMRALGSNARYVGAIGSKKTQAARRGRLLAAGMRADALARLHGPIGLDLGSQTPEEIAVAILAEMIATKYNRQGTPLRDRIADHIHA